MAFGATQSRAAILCLGGWGLQVMLHLAARLRAAQEQRAACGVDAPDLTRITRLVTLLPGIHAHPDGHVPVHLRTLRDDVVLPPLYLETVLSRLEKSAWATSWRDFYTGKEPNGTLWTEARAHHLLQSTTLELTATASSRQALALLRATEPVLQAVPWPGDSPSQPADGQPATRAQVFRTGVERGAVLAPLLSTHLIDPIRQDELAPGDPFVQTTLYVVGPLYEPLTSPLIWPTVTHLLAFLGQRHVAQVVGIFATGSYAQDASRRVEDAAAVAALAELEALAGNVPEALEVLRGLVSAPEIAAWVGRPLFDRIYLVDREKTNQGLVGHSYELTALVANALQALIETDGRQYVDDQVGIDLRDARQRPYSLLGAATDTMPLDYLFQELHQDEERRLVQEWVCPPSAETESAEEPHAGLEDLGIAPAQILAQLVMRLPDLFWKVDPSRLVELEVHPNFVFPRALARELRRLDPESWLAAFQAHLEMVEGDLADLLAEPNLARIWGVEEEAGSPLPDRLLSASGRRVRRRVAEILAASPDGLVRARAQVQGWLHQLREGRRQLLSDLSPGQIHLRQTQIQVALRAWHSRYGAVGGGRASLAGALARATLLILGLVGLTAVYLVAFGRGLDPTLDGGLLAAFGLGSYAGALMHYRRRRGRLRSLRRERVELARQALSLQLQEHVYQGLSQVYDALEQDLRDLAAALTRTQERLQAWARSQSMPPVPPPNVRTTHLYRLHLDDRVWQLCRQHLHGQADEHGRRLEQRLQDVWQDPAWRRQLDRLLLEEGRTDTDLDALLEEQIRGQVRRAVAELSPVRAPQVRRALIRLLAEEAHIEHLLWRGDPTDQALGATSPGRLPGGRRARVEAHLEELRNLAKPAANYDVADQLAAQGVVVDLVAVSGRPDSDLDEGLLQEFRLARLVTGNPFHITVVRTVHGLRAGDLESMQRYWTELNRLGPSGWQALLLCQEGRQVVYGVREQPSPSRPSMWQ